MPTRRPRRRAAASPVTADATAVDGGIAAPAASPRWLARGIALSVVTVMLVAGGVWIAQTRGIAGTIAPRYSVSGPDTGAKTIEAAATTGALPAAPSAAEKVVTPAPDRPEPPAARTIDARALPASITLPRGRGDGDAPPIAAPAPVAPPTPLPIAIEPPRPAPVAVVSPPPRPAPDRWQRLADQIERCPSDALARAVCQESLRLEHCEGQWGRVAACPARVERDYGN